LISSKVLKLRTPTIAASIMSESAVMLTVDTVTLALESASTVLGWNIAKVDTPVRSVPTNFWVVVSNPSVVRVAGRECRRSGSYLLLFGLGTPPSSDASGTASWLNGSIIVPEDVEHRA